MTRRYITGKAAAFGGRVESLELEIELRDGKNPIVRVWDDVADAYTTCHSLSVDEQDRLVAQARAGQPDTDGAAVALYHNSLGMR